MEERLELVSFESVAVEQPDARSALALARSEFIGSIDIVVKARDSGSGRILSGALRVRVYSSGTIGYGISPLGYGTGLLLYQMVQFAQQSGNWQKIGDVAWKELDVLIEAR